MRVQQMHGLKLYQMSKCYNVSMYFERENINGKLRLKNVSEDITPCNVVKGVSQATYSLCTISKVSPNKPYIQS